ncbi:glycosyltransferase [Candidatus Woesearchaeota archaeon]|nr:glycosyltransferase [Candidatus Woesearchaeota archaeon]
MPKQAISLCIITKNEEKYLEQCLSSVKDLVDEMIILDTGSIDKTKEIAERFKAKLFDFKWTDDFSAARNESLRHATKDWILVMDADEVIDGKDLENVKNLIDSGNEFAGYQLEQRSYLENYFEGAYENKSEFGPVRKYPFYISNFLVRLFRNKRGIHFKHRVHELAEDSMNEQKLGYAKTGIVIHHFGSLKERGLISSKVEMYSRMILHQLEEHPDSPRYAYQAARMCLGKNDLANALKFFRKTAKIDPHYKLVFSEIAKVYMRMNDKNKAVENFRKSMNANPDNPSPANNLAVVHMSMEKFEEAKEILEEQMKKHPENKALKYNYEECLRNLK